MPILTKHRLIDYSYFASTLPANVDPFMSTKTTISFSGKLAIIKKTTNNQKSIVKILTPTGEALSKFIVKEAFLAFGWLSVPVELLVFFTIQNNIVIYSVSGEVVLSFNTEKLFQNKFPRLNPPIFEEVYFNPSSLLFLLDGGFYFIELESKFLLGFDRSENYTPSSYFIPFDDSIISSEAKLLSSYFFYTPFKFQKDNDNLVSLTKKHSKILTGTANEKIDKKRLLENTLRLNAFCLFEEGASLSLFRITSTSKRGSIENKESSSEVSFKTYKVFSGSRKDFLNKSVEKIFLLSSVSEEDVIAVLAEDSVFVVDVRKQKIVFQIILSFKFNNDLSSGIFKILGKGNGVLVVFESEFCVYFCFDSLGVSGVSKEMRTCYLDEGQRFDLCKDNAVTEESAKASEGPSRDDCGSSRRPRVLAVSETGSFLQGTACDKVNVLTTEGTFCLHMARASLDGLVQFTERQQETISGARQSEESFRRFVGMFEEFRTERFFSSAGAELSNMKSLLLKYKVLLPFLLTEWDVGRLFTLFSALRNLQICLFKKYSAIQLEKLLFGGMAPGKLLETLLNHCRLLATFNKDQGVFVLADFVPSFMLENEGKKESKQACLNRAQGPADLDATKSLGVLSSVINGLREERQVLALLLFFENNSLSFYKSLRKSSLVIFPNDLSNTRLVEFILKKIKTGFFQRNEFFVTFLRDLFKDGISPGLIGKIITQVDKGFSELDAGSLSGYMIEYLNILYGDSEEETSFMCQALFNIRKIDLMFKVLLKSHPCLLERFLKKLGENEIDLLLSSSSGLGMKVLEWWKKENRKEKGCPALAIIEKVVEKV